MGATLKRASIVAGVLMLVLFVLFIINQTIQIVDFSSRVNPVLGTVVFWSLIAIYVVLVLLPVTLLVRLPKPLRPPKSEESPDFPAYLEVLKKRLSGNPHLKGLPLSERRDVEEALASLNTQADALIKRTASRVFITTAISQNGRLDAFLVLSALSQLVWQIAHLFYQRPSPRDFVNLYANVAATAFVASELDDIDLHEQLTPVLSSTMGSVAHSIPGTSLVVNSILTGSGNAFLVLRIGIITKSYCGALHVAERRAIRRGATIDAARMLGSVVAQGAGKISKAVWDASKDKMIGKVTGTAARVKEAGRRLISKGAVRESSASVTQDPRSPEE
jgi:hypothetical protein